MRACRHQQHRPLEVPRGAVPQEEYRSRGSDATPTQVGHGERPSCEPHALEAEGSRTFRCVDANRLRVPAGSSRPGAGEQIIRWVENENETHNGEHLLDWELEVLGARCVVIGFEDLGLPFPFHHGNETG